MNSIREQSFLAVRIAKFGPLREPIRMLLFTLDQFSHIIRSFLSSFVLAALFGTGTPGGTSETLARTPPVSYFYQYPISWDLSVEKLRKDYQYITSSREMKQRPLFAWLVLHAITCDQALPLSLITRRRGPETFLWRIACKKDRFWPFLLIGWETILLN